jgi:hypothetical protein
VPDEAAEPDFFVPELLAALPELPAPVPEPAVPAEVPAEVLDALPVLEAGRFVLVTAACVDPGSAAATAPAATTLAKLTVTVAALRRRRPRSRSATACETSRASRACDDPSRGSGLIMESVWHIQLRGLLAFDLRTLCVRPGNPGGIIDG